VTAAKSRSPTWTCASCAIVTRYLPGFAPPADLPTGWTRDGDGAPRCLPCRRQHIGEAALAEAGLAPFDPGAAEAKARALIAFELERDPDQMPKQIATVAGVSAVKVGMILRDLRRAGGAA
jgi:hypothetical protein